MARFRRCGSSDRNSSLSSRRLTPTSFSILARFSCSRPFTSSLLPPMERMSRTSADMRDSISPTPSFMRRIVSVAEMNLL